MSAIAAKAINGSMGTSDFKGLDEIIKEGFQGLIPKTIVISKMLNSDGTHQNMEIALNELLDLERTSIELIGEYGLSPKEYIAPTIFNRDGENKTAIRIYYRFADNLSKRQATVKVTTYL